MSDATTAELPTNRRDWRVWFGLSATFFWLWLGYLYVEQNLGFSELAVQPVQRHGVRAADAVVRAQHVLEAGPVEVDPLKLAPVRLDPVDAIGPRDAGQQRQQCQRGACSATDHDGPSRGSRLTGLYVGLQVHDERRSP